MKVIFWTCIFISFDNGRIAILDAGIGIRKLGEDFIHRVRFTASTSTAISDALK